MPGRLRRLFALTAAAAAATLIAAVPAASPAAALETDTLGISPVGEPDNFHIDLLPGQRVEREAVVTNRSDQTRHVLVYPVDATDTAQGGFALGQRDEPRSGVGAWVRLPVRELTLAPNSRTPLPFDLKLPAGAEPGERAGGIVLESDPEDATQDLGDNFAFQLDRVVRVGVRIYLNVAGEAVTALQAGKLTSERSAEGIRFALPVTNTGNVRVDPVGTLAFTGRGLPGNPLDMNRVEPLLPGSTVTLTGLWTDPPRFGIGTATATVTYGADQQTTSSTHLRLLPIGLLAAVLLILTVTSYAGYRFTRFLRRARAALRRTTETPELIDSTSRKNP